MQSAPYVLMRHDRDEYFAVASIKYVSCLVPSSESSAY